MQLNELQKGEKAIIESFLDKELSLTLMEHGIMPNQEVEILYVAPFKGPMAIQVNENVVSIRNEEAQRILIKDGRA